jgi:N-acetylglucosamine transport system substrate-binding protein
MTHELLEKGYFQDGALGMTHTESQVEFLQGRAAMIPCGTWLEAEMIEQIPEGFRMRMMQIPAVNPDVDPAIVGTVVNYWMVPADAKNPELGAEYLKLLFSVPNCEKWVKEKMSLTPILGTGSVAESEALLSAVEVMENSSVVFIEPFVGWTPWYPSLGKVIDDGMAALLNRDISPKEYVDTIEAEAERIRNDERIPKYTRQY